MEKLTPEEARARLHKLAGCHASFKAVQNLLRAGYRFDDADAPAALTRLDQALVELEDEVRKLRHEWLP